MAGAKVSKGPLLTFANSVGNIINMHGKVDEEAAKFLSQMKVVITGTHGKLARPALNTLRFS